MPYLPSRLARLLSLALLIGTVPAAAQEPPREGFAGETTVTVVEIPVQVVRGGEPVRGLTADDFRIYDEGERREILSFQVVDRAGTPAPAAEAAPGDEVPPAARRHFLLLFDLEFTEPLALESSARAARGLVADGLAPSDVVGITFFSGRSGVSQVLGFTPDHAQALRALDAFLDFLTGKPDPASGKRSAARGQDALGLTFADWNLTRNDIGAGSEREGSLAEETLGAIGSDGGGGRRAGSATETIADMAGFAAEDVRQRRAARASAFVGALGGLAEQMRYVEGEKYLVLFSRGYESELYTASGQSWFLDEIEGMLERFRRAGWRVLGIEASRDLGTANKGQRREALFMIARETGGALIENRYDLAEAVSEILDRTEVTYLLSFQTPTLPADGAFRTLRVELAGGGRGAEVSHRSGYFVPRPFSALGPAERRATTSELLLSGRESDEIGAHLMATPVGLGGEGARVSVLFDVDGPGLLAGRAREATRVEVLAYAFGRDREVTGTVARTLTVTAEQAARLRDGGGLVLYGELALAPGEHEVRAVVRNLEDGRAAVRTVRLVVPGPAAGEASLLRPVFSSDRSAGRILVRIEGGKGALPFAVGGRPFLPWVTPVITPDAPAVVVFPGRGMEALAGSLRVRILDPSGATVKGGGFALVENVAGAPPGGLGQIVLTLRPDGLAAGEYALQAVATAADGRVVVSPPAPFRVGAPGAS